MATQTEALYTLPAQIDGLIARADGMIVAATSRVFGNDWDGGVTAYMPDKQQKSCHLPSGVTGAAFVGATSEAVALSCDDGNVVVLSLSSMGEEGWRPLQMFADHENIVSSVSCSALDKDVIASCSVDQTVKVWSMKGDDGACLTTLRGHCAPVWDVAYSPVERNMVASVGQDGRLLIWDDRTTTPAASLDQAPPASALFRMSEGAPLFSLCWNEEKVMVGSENGEIFIFDPRALTAPLETLTGHTDAVRSMAVARSADDKAMLVSGGDDCAVMVRAMADLAAAPTVVERHSDYVRALCAVPGGGAVYSGSWDKTIAKVQI